MRVPPTRTFTSPCERSVTEALPRVAEGVSDSFKITIA
jgi:hypothetical protein